MSALETLKQMQQKIEDLKFEVEYERDAAAEAKAATDKKEDTIAELEAQVSVTVECLNEEKKAEQEAFNTLLVKFQSGGAVTEDDFKRYAAERAITTAEVYPEPETEEEAEKDPQSSAA